MKKTSAFLTALAIVLSVSAVSCGNDPVGSASEDNIVLEIPSGTEAASEEASEAAETTAASSAKEKATTAASSADEEEDATDTKTEAATEAETDAPTEAPKATEAPKPTEAPAPAPTEAPAAEQPQTPAPQSGVSMNYDTLLSNASGLIASLGTPSYEGGGAACTQGGYDVKVYRFDGVEVQAYIDGGAEYVFDVKVTSGDYSVNGVRIGMSKAEAEALLGSGEAAGSMYIYMNGNKETDVTYSGDVVKEIELYTAV